MYFFLSKAYRGCILPPKQMRQTGTVLTISSVTFMLFISLGMILRPMLQSPQKHHINPEPLNLNHASLFSSSNALNHNEK